MTEEKVILVDAEDNPVGTEAKMQAHLNGDLHRAISILIYNTKGEMLLQQRALTKYHTPGLWTNACCSHPRPGESTLGAAKRRLLEEMGMEAELKEKFTFIYRAVFDNGLTEHELDHVFIGITDTDPAINPDEVNDFKWISMNELMQDISLNPEKYTIWFRIILREMINNYPELITNQL